MKTRESLSVHREPTEAGTFPPMRNPASSKGATPPESTVDYRNHNQVAALFSSRKQAIEAVHALRNHSRYTPSAIGVLPRSRMPDRRYAKGGVVAAGLLGGMFGGVAAFSSKPRLRASSVLVSAGIGAILGCCIAGA